MATENLQTGSQGRQTARGWSRATLLAIAAVVALAGCQTKAEPPPRQTHECVVTPYDLVECNEIAG